MLNSRKRVCTACREEKDISEYHDWRKYWCRPCNNQKMREYRRRNRDKINADRRTNYHQSKDRIIDQGLKRLYGIALVDYRRMFEAQKGNCAICGKHQSEFERKFDVDHDHQTGQIRGLCCIRCNRGIGLLQDSPETLEAAARYLRQARESADKKPLR